MVSTKTLRSFACVLSLFPGMMMAQSMQQKFVEDKPFMHIPRSPNTASFTTHPANRTIDGTNNNINPAKKTWGASDIQLFRDMPAQYDASDNKNAMNGVTRPSPREISNLVCDEPVTQFSSRELAAFVYVWGQFLDHDMDLTPTGTTESVPVPLPANETLFTVPIPFKRSEIAAGTGVTNARQQTNLNTSWIDGSQIYGSEITRANWLRTFVNGKMKTSTGNMLPWNTMDAEQTGAIDPNSPSMANDANKTLKTFAAGDVRAAEHPGIAALHTIFVREHNRICDELVAQGWTNDELIYQRARKMVGALVQVITYQEWLPAVGVTLSNYNNYNPNKRPDITNIFATAAFRIGHTMVADEVLLRDNDCEPVGPDVLDLIDIFLQPNLILDHGVDAFLKGFATHTQYETDTKVNDILRNFLFGPPNAPVRSGLDLASLNLQRGRDHGLPSYSQVRAQFTGVTITSFSQITTNTALASQLQQLFGNVNNIDVWIGLLAEDRLPNKSVGTTMHAILKAQFENLRDGDYYFYKNDPFLPSNIRSAIKHTTFADVLERNTGLTDLQENVFFAETCPGDSLGDDDRIMAPDQTAHLKGVQIYPNPVSNELTVNFENADEYGVVQILSTTGAVAAIGEKQRGTNTLILNLNKLTPGIYFTTITSGSNVQTVRVVKID